jgi:hypothetical protein
MIDNERIATDIRAAYEAIHDQIGAPVANQADLTDSMKRIVRLIER